LKPIDLIEAIEKGKEIFLMSNTSISGVGAYYGQGKDWLTCQLAGFMSKKFLTAQYLYRTYEQETLAILEGLCKWEDKLLGRQFCVIMDHQALQFFASQAHL
jgi:hypothetical protein